MEHALNSVPQLRASHAYTVARFAPRQRKRLHLEPEPEVPVGDAMARCGASCRAVLGVVFLAALAYGAAEPFLASVESNWQPWVNPLPASTPLTWAPKTSSNAYLTPRARNW